MATTLSLVVIFLPVAFMTGYAARFIYPFGWTMAFAIIVSMLVSFTLTPMLSSRFLRLADAARDSKTKEQGFFHVIDRWYAVAHLVAGASARDPWRVIARRSRLTIPFNRAVGRTFIPDEDMGMMTIHADAPQGTSLEGTSALARRSCTSCPGRRAWRSCSIRRARAGQPLPRVRVSQAARSTEIVASGCHGTHARDPVHAPGLASIVAGKAPLGGGEGELCDLGKPAGARHRQAVPSRSSYWPRRSNCRAWWT